MATLEQQERRDTALLRLVAYAHHAYAASPVKWSELRGALTGPLVGLPDTSGRFPGQVGYDPEQADDSEVRSARAVLGSNRQAMFATAERLVKQGRLEFVFTSWEVLVRLPHRNPLVRLERNIEEASHSIMHRITSEQLAAMSHAGKPLLDTLVQANELLQAAMVNVKAVQARKQEVAS